MDGGAVAVSVAQSQKDTEDGDLYPQANDTSVRKKIMTDSESDPLSEIALAVTPQPPPPPLSAPKSEATTPRSLFDSKRSNGSFPSLSKVGINRGASPPAGPSPGGAPPLRDPQSVKVAVNIRPLIGPEIASGCQACIHASPGEPTASLATRALQHTPL